MLCLIGLAVFGWHVAHGGFYSDDWSNADGYRFLGFSRYTDVQYHTLGSKPLLAVLLSLSQATLGLHMKLHLLLAVLLGVATATCFFAVLRALGFAGSQAFGLATLSLLFPWSDASRLWPTASLNNIAICLYLIGLLVALRGLQRHHRWHIGAAVLYAASILTYEVAAFVGFCSVLLYIGRAPRRTVLVRWGIDVLFVGAATMYTALRTVKPTVGFGHQLHVAGSMARQALDLAAQALVPIPAVRSLVGIAMLLLVAAGLITVLRTPGDDSAELRSWMITLVIGGVFVAASYLVLVPSGAFGPLLGGLENRVNILAALPLLVASYSLLMIAIWLVRIHAAVPRRWLAAGVGIAMVTIAGGYVVRLASDTRAWDRSTVLQHTILAAIARGPHPRSGTTIYTFGAPAQTGDRIPVFFDKWDLNGAVRVTLGDPSLRAYPVYAGATFDCQPGAIHIGLPSPRGRLDGPAQFDVSGYPYFGPDPGASYGKVVFVDPTRGRTLIETQRGCRAAISEFHAGPFL